jgi:paraquat-inducible protein B
MYAKKGGEFKSHFIGYDHAYRNVEGGEYFVLNTPRGDSSVKVGTPIYLKNVKVGQVEYVVLSLDDASVDVIVFIQKRYVPYVHTDSKFWIRSTMEVALANGTLDVSVAPVTDLIQGAIEFSSTGKDPNSRIPESFVFKLYPSKSVVESKQVGYGGAFIKHFVIHTEDPIAKLRQNALVRYEGFEVGKVSSIKLSYDKQSHKMKGRVHVEIDTSAFEDADDATHQSGEKNFYQAVAEGLRAKIVPTDPITGMLYVDLVFETNTTKAVWRKENGIDILPSVASEDESIMASVSRILKKVEDLKLQKLLSSVTKIVEESRKPVAHADEVLLALKQSIDDINALTKRESFKKMPDEINRTLKSLNRTLYVTRKTLKGYESNSLITHQISTTLKAVKQASDEMDLFLKMLNRKPNSLIFGDK